MAVNPLDTSVPIGTSNIAELTAELRGIKARLVADKAGIEALAASLSAISSITPFASDLLGAGDTEDVHDVLGYSSDVQDMVALADIPALQAFLGVPANMPEMVIGTGTWTITWPSGFKINAVRALVNSTTHNVTWQDPFITTVMHLSAGGDEENNGILRSYALHKVHQVGLTGCKLLSNITPRSITDQRWFWFVAFGV